MFSNAVLAGGIAGAYVAALVLHLNPSLRLDDPATWPLLAAVLLAYGVHLTVAFYAVIVLRQVLSTEGLSPGWLSYRVLSWLCAASSTAAAALLWHNVGIFEASLDPESGRRMLQAAVILTVCAAALVALAIVRLSRQTRSTAVLFGLVLLASVALPVAVRGAGTVEAVRYRTAGEPAGGSAGADGRRVAVLALDGASLDFISPAVADGRLPNFGRVLEGGASMHLATLRPTQPGPVWTAAATGKLPWRNGVRSAARYRAIVGGASADLLPDFCFAHALVSTGLFTETIQTSDALRAAAFWDILGRAGLTSTIVRWPLTWPARPVAGSMVPDVYHRASDITLALGEPGLTYPADLASRLTTVARPGIEGSDPFVPAAFVPGAMALAALDRFYVSLADALADEAPTAVTALRLQSLDLAGHYYLRYAMPQDFGDVSDEERDRFGRVVDQYYAYADHELGRLLARQQPGDLLLVVSPFGIEPLSLFKRVLELAVGDPDTSGTHERAPDGFLLAYGDQVRPGRRPRGSVVDLAPTLLYYYGLPVGRDMDGAARADLFTGEFSAERPITYIPTHEP